MFENKEDDYTQATQYASINNPDGRSRLNGKVILFNLVAVFGVMGYLGFDYFQNESDTLKKTEVSNVNYNSDNYILSQDSLPSSVSSTDTEEDQSQSDSELAEILNGVDVDNLKDDVPVKSAKTVDISNLSKEISRIVDSLDARDEFSIYTEAIRKEIEPESVSQTKRITIPERLITVRKGDTLATLSKKYYGNSNDFTKIIDGNAELTEESHTIFVGQSIRIPY